jgi:hypothetical protein
MPAAAMVVMLAQSGQPFSVVARSAQTCSGCANPDFMGLIAEF